MDAKDAETAFYVAEADKATTGLRAAVVENVAEVFRDAGHDEPFATSYATFSIDSVLDVLADRADEWDDLAFEHSSDDGRSGLVGPTDYLAVLRGDTE